MKRWGKSPPLLKVISDAGKPYELKGQIGSDQELLDYIKGLKDSGVHFIPVGALQSSGYFSVSEFFRTRLAELGMPILHGAVNKLIHQLRYLLN